MPRKPFFSQLPRRMQEMIIDTFLATVMTLSENGNAFTIAMSYADFDRILPMKSWYEYFISPLASAIGKYEQMSQSDNVIDRVFINILYKNGNYVWSIDMFEHYQEAGIGTIAEVISGTTVLDEDDSKFLASTALMLMSTCTPCSKRFVDFESPCFYKYGFFGDLDEYDEYCMLEARVPGRRKKHATATLERLKSEPIVNYQRKSPSKVNFQK